MIYKTWGCGAEDVVWLAIATELIADMKREKIDIVPGFKLSALYTHPFLCARV